jgi:hypothetical protein
LGGRARDYALLLAIGGIVDGGVMIGASAVILLVIFIGNLATGLLVISILVIDITEVIGASSYTAIFR